MTPWSKTWSILRRIRYSSWVQRLAVAPRAEKETPFEVPLAFGAFAFGVIQLANHKYTAGSIEAESGYFIAKMWAAAIMIGGGAIMYGRFRDRLRPELAGLIFTSYGMFIYSLAIFRHGTAGSYFIAFFLLMFCRGAITRMSIVWGALRTKRKIHDPEVQEFFQETHRISDERERRDG